MLCSRHTYIFLTLEKIYRKYTTSLLLKMFAASNDVVLSFCRIIILSDNVTNSLFKLFKIILRCNFRAVCTSEGLTRIGQLARLRSFRDFRFVKLGHTFIHTLHAFFLLGRQRPQPSTVFLCYNLDLHFSHHQHASI